jgi:RimJ/RimL family protein N-acetyltransferase
MPGRSRPPVTIRTARLLLRRLQPSDAPAVQNAIIESLDHLRPHMPWAAAEPVSLGEKSQTLRKFRRQFILGSDFNYGIYRHDDDRRRPLVGCCGMHRRIGAGAIEIGYWIHVGQINQGYATEAAAALTRCAFELAGMRRIEIHCHPANVASAAVARKLGYRLVVTISSCIASATSPVRDTMIFAKERQAPSPLPLEPS